MGKIKGGNTSYGNELDFTETANWNSAQQYSEVLITQHFINADRLKEIARFGTLDLEGSILGNIPPHILIKARYNALERYYFEIESVIENSFFALRTKDKPDVEKIRKSMEKIKPLIKKVIVREGGKESIREELFEKIFEALRALMEELKSPINKSDLIFGHKEEFDPLAHKQAIKENLINVG